LLSGRARSTGMLTPPPLETRQPLHLTGLYQALLEPRQGPARAALTCAERLGLRGDRARTARETRRLPTRWRQAQLRQTAGLDASDSRHPRGLETALMARRAACPWGREPHHVLITGPTGMGTTWRG